MVNLSGMDELTYAIIEAECEAEELFEAAVRRGDGGAAVLSDGEGAEIRVYADGSYVAKGQDGRLL